MRSILAALVFFTGSPALARVTYHTKFVNPVVDPRVAFEACSVDGALYGIAKGEIGDTLCWGQAVENGKTYFVFRAKGSNVQQYFEAGPFRDVGGWSQDGSMGERQMRVTLYEATPELKRVPRARQSTLKFNTQWIYSEGSTFVRGKLPGDRQIIDAPMFALDTIDDELRDFVREIEN